MIASVPMSFVFLAAQAFAAARPTITAAPAVAQPHPWYVKAISDQVVNYCFFGGLCGMGMGGSDSNGGYTIVSAASFGDVSTVSYQDSYTETYVASTATTLYTTVPGNVVTIYGEASAAAEATIAQTFTSVYTTCAHACSPTPAAHNVMANIARIESYAHAVADAIVAPPQITQVLSKAYEDIMQHGYIHADKAVELASQARAGLKALQTDPAYSKQRQNLAANAAHIDFNRALAKATNSHKAGVARLLEEPSGKKAYDSVKNLGHQFIKEFLHQ